MNKSLVFSALFASALALSARPAAACAGDWPRCYFAGDIGELKQTELGALWLVGRHFFPDWAGKAPRGNGIRSDEGHAMDFATAAARAGAADARGDYERYRACAEEWEAAVRERKTWRTPFVPVEEDERADWPAWAKQFYLYSLGRAQLLADATLSDPPAWEELLALPEEERKERTLWVLHGKVLAAKGFAAADERLRAFRAACDRGEFTDTCGLEAAILRQLLLRDSSLGLRWMPLVLAAYGGVSGEEDWQTPLDVHRMLSVMGATRYAAALADRERDFLARLADEYSVWRRAAWRNRAARLRGALADDPVGREILFVLDGGLEGMPPLEAPDLSTPLLSADRAAWRAFDRGDFGTAKALLAYAPADSLLRLFLEARFARMDGDTPRAAEKLRAWLAVFRERGGNEWCDFAILGDNCFDTFGDVTTRPWELYVAGTLGMVLVEQRDFAEALGVFVRDAQSWRDAAFVAERCLETGELASLLPALEESMAGTASAGEFAGDLETLLARRLMRENRPGEAGAWFARAVEERRRACEGKEERWSLRHAQDVLTLWQVRQKTAKRAHAETDPDKRAAAFVDLARIERSAGMELYATELEPDVRVFSCSTPSSAVGVNGLDALRAENWRVVEDLPSKRWHWRHRAAQTARRAAAMAGSEGVKAAALMLSGGFVFADGAAADEAYRMLSDLPTHPAGAYAREKHWFKDWGGGPVAEWIRRDNRREAEEWAAGGWECTPESLEALAEGRFPERAGESAVPD